MARALNHIDNVRIRSPRYRMSQPPPARPEALPDPQCVRSKLSRLCDVSRQRRNIPFRFRHATVQHAKAILPGRIIPAKTRAIILHGSPNACPHQPASCRTRSRISSPPPERATGPPARTSCRSRRPGRTATADAVGGACVLDSMEYDWRESSRNNSRAKSPSRAGPSHAGNRNGIFRRWRNIHSRESLLDALRNQAELPDGPVAVCDISISRKIESDIVDCIERAGIFRPRCSLRSPVVSRRSYTRRAAAVPRAFAHSFPFFAARPRRVDESSRRRRHHERCQKFSRACSMEM